MSPGDLTGSTPVYVDVNDPVLIKSTIDALNLTAVTDMLFVIHLPTQHRMVIFKVAREADS